MPSPLGPGGATRPLCECDSRTLTDLARNIVKESDLSGEVLGCFFFFCPHTESTCNVFSF